MSNRPEVVEALIAAHSDTATPLYALAAVEFRFSPPPTPAEKEEAHARVVQTRNETLQTLANGGSDDGA